MKRTILTVLPATAALLLAACDQPATESSESGPAEVAVIESTPAPDDGNAAEALAAQAIGKKLLGNTVMLSGNGFVAADLTTAPEYYIAYYSASW